MSYVITNTMSVSPEAIANEFIDLSKEERGHSVSNMKIQKLVYIAHGFYLGFYDKPLSNCAAETWQYGPVFPELYRKLKKYGADEISERIDTNDRIQTGSTEAKLIKTIWKTYGHHSASRLMASTHSEGTPWDVTSKKLGNSAEIPNSLIKEHFEEIIKQAETIKQNQ